MRQKLEQIVVLIKLNDAIRVIVLFGGGTDMKITSENLYVIKHRDLGKMTSVFSHHNINSFYDFGAGEYIFFNEIDYHAALMLV